jgi:predicted SAM-dependent methyltransferase
MSRTTDFLKQGQLFSRGKFRNLQKLDSIRLELGSGPKRGNGGWTTVDISGADINWDLRKGIPLDNDSVDVIYTSHMLEHIPFSELEPFIIECKRVLKVGGSLSVCVPNAGYYINAYCEQKVFRNPETFYQEARCETGSYIDQVNYIAYMGGEHAYMFDEENLVKILSNAGFYQVALRKFDSTLDLLERDHESIYALATK